MTRGKRSFIFIGAHNVEGMRALYQAGLVFDHALVAFSIRQSDVIAIREDCSIDYSSADFTVLIILALCLKMLQRRYFQHVSLLIGAES